MRSIICFNIRCYFKRKRVKLSLYQLIKRYKPHCLSLKLEMPNLEKNDKKIQICKYAAKYIVSWGNILNALYATLNSASNGINVKRVFSIKFTTKLT